MPLGFARNAGLITGGGTGGPDISASGHTTSWTSANYQFYKWNGTGSFTVNSNPMGDVGDIIIVGGGGAGRWPHGGYGIGGGGAGNCRHLMGISLPLGTHSVNIGGGGNYNQTTAPDTYVPSPLNSGNGWSPGPGNHIYSHGGGVGSSYPYGQCGPGGSGGGGDGQWTSSCPGNQPNLSPQSGYPGGTGAYSQYGYYAGGGGGGAFGNGNPMQYGMGYMASGNMAGGGQGAYYASFRDSAGPSGTGYDSFAGGGSGYFTPGWYGQPTGGTQYGNPAGGPGSAGTGAGSSGNNAWYGGSGTFILRYPI